MVREGVSTVRRQNRRARTVLGISLSGLGGAVALASAAFACTAVMFPMAVTPSSGPRLTQATLTAEGTKTNATYKIQYFDARAVANGGECHSGQPATGVLGRVTSTNSGTFSTNITIPKKTPAGVKVALGDMHICAKETAPVPKDTWGGGPNQVEHLTFTVTSI